MLTVQVLHSHDLDLWPQHWCQPYKPEKAGVTLLDCLERRGVVVDWGVPEGVAAGGGGPARVCVEAEAAKLACNSSRRIVLTALPAVTKHILKQPQPDEWSGGAPWCAYKQSKLSQWGGQFWGAGEGMSGLLLGECRPHFFNPSVSLSSQGMMLQKL